MKTATPETTPRLLDAARAMLDAFSGNVPTWLRTEFTQLESAVKAVEHQRRVCR